jgi:hypothetical protein
LTTDEDEQPDTGLNDFDKAARLNFRNYPSTSLVMIAALGSGLRWMLYKWSGWRRSGQRAVLDDGWTIEGDGPEAGAPIGRSAQGRATSCPAAQPTTKPVIRIQGRSRQLCWSFNVAHSFTGPSTAWSVHTASFLQEDQRAALMICSTKADPRATALEPS